MKWNLTEQQAEETYETIGLDFAPSIDIYGYAYSFLTVQYGKWLGISFTFKTVPVDIKAISMHFRKPITMPNWWAMPEEPQPMCFGVSSGVKPVSVKLGWQFVYPVCSLSFADFVSWKGTKLGLPNEFYYRFKSILDEACTPEAYGSNYGNDTPWMSWTLLKYLEQDYVHVPFVCDISFNSSAP